MLIHNRIMRNIIQQKSGCAHVFVCIGVKTCACMFPKYQLVRQHHRTDVPSWRSTNNLYAHAWSNTFHRMFTHACLQITHAQQVHQNSKIALPKIRMSS